MTNCTDTIPGYSRNVPALSWSAWLMAGVTLLSNDLVKLTDWMAERREKARQRHALSGLSDDLLKDIGISRAQAMGESDKPFWKD
ncbi:MAG: DUF1127 domain-containing protein [Rhodospirillales bacterium]|nr:DUF1127 domain-containing protein [Rhodospirillales bacterium]